MIYKYGIGEHVYIVENGMHIKEVVIVNISSGFYQVCFTDKRGSIKLRESRLYKTISEAATNNSACLLYTSDAADDLLCVDLGGSRNIKKKTRR